MTAGLDSWQRFCRVADEVYGACLGVLWFVATPVALLWFLFR